MQKSTVVRRAALALAILAATGCAGQTPASPKIAAGAGKATAGKATARPAAGPHASVSAAGATAAEATAPTIAEDVKPAVEAAYAELEKQIAAKGLGGGIPEAVPLTRPMERPAINTEAEPASEERRGERPAPRKLMSTDGVTVAFRTIVATAEGGALALQAAEGPAGKVVLGCAKSAEGEGCRLYAATPEGEWYGDWLKGADGTELARGMIKAKSGAFAATTAFKKGASEAAEGYAKDTRHEVAFRWAKDTKGGFLEFIAVDREQGHVAVVRAYAVGGTVHRFDHVSRL